MTFDQLSLIDPLRRAVAAQGYTTPTPIQAQAIPPAQSGRDVLGVAQTGTGKTAAFALPILQRLAAREPRRGIRCLVLTPTRELAAQVGDSFSVYGRHLTLKTAVIFGGVGQKPQEDVLRRGVDILVATPGRLLDLMQQRILSLRDLEIFVLDEADRMLDMGFLPDVRRVIAALPEDRQTLFFSATMPPDITALAKHILSEPVRIDVNPVSVAADTVEQRMYLVERSDKRDLLVHLLKDASLSRALVFTRTKHGANRVAEQLQKAGVDADAIHGNKSQGARVRALEGFREGGLRVLVATDIAARGIDIDGISHVINFDLPNVAEQYVHRIGRTGRAGASGIALSFCDAEERAYLRDIERLLGHCVPMVSDHPFRSTVPQGARPPPSAPPQRANGNRGHPAPHGRSHHAGQSRAGAGRRSQPARAASAAALPSSPPPPPQRRYSKWS